MGCNCKKRTANMTRIRHIQAKHNAKKKEGNTDEEKA